jgi:ParB-like chromosome segregation protein Spo0J
MDAATLSLDAITVDPDIQQRIAIDPNLVADYAETIATWQASAPLTVYRDEDGAHWLADGFHRHAAASKAGLEAIATHIKPGTKRDAILHSLSANATHGQKRNAADLKKAYETAVANRFCSPTDTETVAKILNCSERRARDLTADARNQGKAEQRAAILAAVDEGLSQREVAQRLGISVGLVNATVQKRHTSKTERFTATNPEPGAGAGDLPSKPEAHPARDHLSQWQRELLHRLDAQAALNGRAGVADALQAWLAEVAA